MAGYQSRNYVVLVKVVWDHYDVGLKEPSACAGPSSGLVAFKVSTGS